jgi:rare lipoprotein A
LTCFPHLGQSPHLRNGKLLTLTSRFRGFVAVGLHLQISLCDNSMEKRLMKHLLLAVMALFGLSAVNTEVRADWREAILGAKIYDSAPAAKPRAARVATTKATKSASKKVAAPKVAAKKVATKTASKVTRPARAVRVAAVETPTPRARSRSGIAAPARALAKPIYGGGSGSETGVASYYWQPQPLASGGRFNPNAMTAAHKTLPFGTRVRVTDKSTGRSVDVTINDRGPYIAGRIIDLSKAAAASLGITGRGVAPVSVARL